MDQNSQAMIAKQGIIDVNNLSYNLKPDLSVTTSRTTTTQFFQNQDYAENSTMVCILNTGASFVYGPNSTIAFDVRVARKTGNSNPELGCFFSSPGSAANIFSRITIMSRSGVVLERIDSVNQLAAIKFGYEHDQSYSKTIGSMMGRNSTVFKTDANTEQRFVIPMSLISGLFAYQNLLPSALMSGLRIEIALTPAYQAFSLKGNAGSNDYTYGYVVINPRIQCDAYMLTDSIMRSLNESAASSGLEVVFPTYFTTIQSRSSTLLNMESRRACSRALSAFYTEQLPVTVFQYELSPMRSVTLNTLNGPTSVQFRAGSLYFPNTSIAADDPLVCAPENYQMALQTFNKFNTTISSNVELVDYTTNGLFVLGTTLERSTVLDLTGIPLSNSRVLALNATFKSNTATTCFLFLEYVTLARVFISNCTVEV